MIEVVCRSFLWTGKLCNLKKSISLPGEDMFASSCGLYVINLCLWNKVAILKQLWVVAMKKDYLWIKWVHSYYIKDQDLEHKPIPKFAAWVIRKIMETREVLQVHSMQGTLIDKLKTLQVHDHFWIKQAYLMSMPQYQKAS